MSNKATYTRLFLTLGLGLGLAGGMACDTEDTPCDNMCDQGLFGNVDETSENGELTCSCSKTKPSQSACESYCEEMGGSAENATVDGKSCACTGLD